jgi:integrase
MPKMGVTLHCYRYATAERAKQSGYPERFAQEVLGHNSNNALATGVRNTQPDTERNSAETDKRRREIIPARSADC